MYRVTEDWVELLSTRTFHSYININTRPPGNRSGSIVSDVRAKSNTHRRDKESSGERVPSARPTTTMGNLVTLMISIHIRDSEAP